LEQGDGTEEEEGKREVIYKRSHLKWACKKEEEKTEKIKSGLG